MPYRWTDTHDRLTLWPHRSMTNGGFVLFMSSTAALLTIPLVAVIGSPVLWWLLVPMVVAVGGLWLALNRSDTDARLTEVLTLAPDRVDLVRTNPRGPAQCWTANPYWVDIALHPKGGPVENYLTLKGAGRTVEIGAFLSADERESLYSDLLTRLRRA